TSRMIQLARLFFFMSCSAVPAYGTTAVPVGSSPAEFRARGAASSDEATVSDLRSRLEELKRGRDIKVRHRSLGEVEAKFVGLAGDSIELLADGPSLYGTETMMLPDVESVWKRKRYTWWGGLVGAAIGAGIVALFTDPAPPEPGFGGLLNYDREEKIILGGLVGAAVGLMAGHEIHSYSRIYP
ncbi:MAG TPA: hypothetical protein VFT13_02305, partial [Candidatus Krumholzibacteria bacterium]|nr:hypothetical protein [Candidatus Krumholzibacteria bacterium]